MLDKGQSLEVVKCDIANDIEWKEFVRNQYNLFYDDKFLNYHNAFGKHFNWHHLKIKIKDTNRVYALITGTLENDGKTFVSCNGVSFGGFLWKHKINVVEFFQIIDAFKNYLRENKITQCRLTVPPFIYLTSRNEENDYALYKSGFEIKNVSITNIVDLDDFNHNKISYTVYKQVVKQQADEIEYELIENIEPDGLVDMYDLLKKDRELKNAVPTHTREELIYLKINLPESIKIFQAKINGKLAGICVLFVINKNIILNFYLAAAEEYKDSTVMKNLLLRTIEWSAENGYKFYDIGTSDVNGKLLEGLFKFKKRFSAHGFLRKNFEINL
ncbi:MAG: GNAT family N-acetyltransferase [Ignavibacteria bacterium]|nr:GNAT family N-acetyltransferase [Ignavibacteria bacterium]